MGTYFVEIRPYPWLSADITEYLAILSVSRMVLIPRKQVAENQEFLLVTVKYYYITSVTKKGRGHMPGGCKTVNSKNGENLVFSRGGVTSVTPFPFHQLIQRDKTQSIVLDVDVLYPLAAGLVRCVHIDGRHQFTQSVAVQFLNADILRDLPVFCSGF